MPSQVPHIKTRPVAHAGLRRAFRHRIAARGGRRHLASGVLKLSLPGTPPSRE